jgi:hypothetical protein
VKHEWDFGKKIKSYYIVGEIERTKKERLIKLIRLPLVGRFERSYGSWFTTGIYNIKGYAKHY